MSDPDRGPVRADGQLDWPVLERQLRSVLDLPAERMSVEQFLFGKANLTYLLRFGTTQVVLRRPPFGDLPPGAHDMFREFRVLSRVSEIYPRAPRALHYEPDESIIGAPFVLQEYREGVVIRGRIPDEFSSHPGAGRRLGLALVAAAADLHAIKVEGTALSDLGRPDGFLRRQVEGWQKRWRRVAANTSLGIVDELGAALHARIPPSQRTSVIHNDLQLGNCLFNPTSPDYVTTLVDWDMATLGDPLADFGTLLTYWSMSGTDIPWPGSDEAIELYRERTNLELNHLPWYRAFAAWKMAVALSQLQYRYSTGESTDPRLSNLDDEVPFLTAQACELLEASG